MNKEYIIIQRDCQKETPITISLTTKSKDEWDLSRIQAQQINPNNISKVVVGPKTVFECYEDPNFGSTVFRVINDTADKVKVHDFGCETATMWKGTFKSFIIMTYDYYDKIHGIRYCDNRSQCNTDEWCLCPDGREHPSWCTKEKRRCMNWNYFINEAPISLINNDNIYTDCLAEQMKLFARDTIKYDVLKEFSRKCAFDKRKEVESFSPFNETILEGFHFSENIDWSKGILSFIFFVLLFFIVRYY